MRALCICAALAIAGCGDNTKPATDDGGVSDASDAALDAPSQATGHCLDRPTVLFTPPTGALPCELLPPGFAAEAP